MDACLISGKENLGKLSSSVGRRGRGSSGSLGRGGGGKGSPSPKETMAATEPPNLALGTKVEVVGKGTRGIVAFIGTTGEENLH